MTTGHLIAAFASGLLIGLAVMLYWVAWHRRRR
ncbi:uncharacterized protein involved in exopolysaccharide biosynthesis [Sphingomonas sp. UYP23]